MITHWWQIQCFGFKRCIIEWLELSLQWREWPVRYSTSHILSVIAKWLVGYVFDIQCYFKSTTSTNRRWCQTACDYEMQYSSVNSKHAETYCPRRLPSHLSRRRHHILPHLIYSWISRLSFFLVCPECMLCPCFRDVPNYALCTYTRTYELCIVIML